jgi:hypothetical protein
VEFEGPLTKEELLKTIDEDANYVLNKTSIDDNDAWPILEKYTIVDQTLERETG